MQEREGEQAEVPACLHVAVAHIAASSASSATFALSALSAYLGQSVLELACKLGALSPHAAYA